MPGTPIRFGLDPIIGLIPGAGDLATSSFSLVVLYRAFRLGVPRVVLFRMVLNVVVDLLAGAVPFVGDLFDFAWKSNSLNLALLERHERPGVKPSSGDWAIVLLAGVLIVGTLALVLIVGRPDGAASSCAVPVRGRVSFRNLRSWNSLP